MRLRRGWIGVGALLVGTLGFALPAGTAGAAGAQAAPTTSLTGVTLTSVTHSTTNYQLSFTVHQTFSTPALLAVAVPGMQFPTTANSVAVTCTPSCGGAPSPTASVWRSTGTVTPLQSGNSSIVLNLFASSSFTGKFSPGETLTVTLTGVTAPEVSGTVPVSVATEAAPGVVLATGTGKVATTTVGTTPALRPLTVAAIPAAPNTQGYPRAGWSATVSGFEQPSTVTSVASLYLPGAAFPTGSASYTVSTCTLTATTTAIQTGSCTGVTVAVDAGTTGLPGTAGLIDLATGSLGTAPTTTVLTGVKVTATGVANPTGPASASQSLLVGASGAAAAALLGTGSSDPLTFVASPTVGLSSTHDTAFPSSVTVGSTANFGLNVANTSDYSWPANGASVAFSLSGIPGLRPGAVTLQCAYEGTPPAGTATTSTFTFTFTTQGSTLVSNPVVVPLTTMTALQLDCGLGLSGSVPIGTLTVTVALSDQTTADHPFVLSTASNHLQVQPIPTTGYTLDASDGGIFTYGTAQFYGSMGGKPLNQPVVGMALTPDGKGYWEVASDGGIFSFGDAAFYGSMGGKPLNKPIVGMAATPDGQGYWLVASDGGIFAFGDATFEGSAGSLSLRAPVVGMAPTADGQGYWLVASDGGIFTYGDATFQGSAGSLKLKAPVVGLAATPDGNGYWEVASDGGIFTFGNATFQGSAGALTLNKPVVGMLATSDGQGYWLVASDGGIFSYGNAAFQGSAGSLTLVKPVVGIA